MCVRARTSADAALNSLLRLDTRRVNLRGIHTVTSDGFGAWPTAVETVDEWPATNASFQCCLETWRCHGNVSCQWSCHLSLTVN